MNTSLEWVILITEQYTAMKAFYEKTLGLPIKRDVPGEEFTQFTLQNCNIAIYGKRYAETLVGKDKIGTPGRAIYSFAASDDIDLLYQQLKAKGVQFIKEPETQPWGQRTAYFTDPDGNIWEIQQWISKPA
ncbi:VOC family protein [Candidatus Gottesmanbacteria bacterium]|nr:VOC family protein [Candidatus Gottesmanbacteria bacterium]